ncbi:hypothetical protein JCM14469_41700 [Desulfatiferula olefinivorans]
MIHTKRDRFIGLVLKGLCTAASVVFYGNRRNADWIYEKMNRPRTYGYAAMNVLFFAAKKPNVYRVISLIVEPVFGCNLSCSYCWHSISHYFEHKSKRPRLMPMDLFRTIVDQAPKSVESLAFALIGEPLLHPDIAAMIAYAKQKGLRTVLYTNGTLLTGTIMDTIARSGLDVLVVSVEPDEANALKHRGVSLSLLRERVRAFLAVRPDTMEVKLSVVVHPDNRPSVKTLSQTFGGLIRHIKLSPLIRYTGTRALGNCIEPWRGSLSILTSGDVSPCCVSAGYRSITVGNLYESTLSDIIHGPGLTQTLQDFIDGKRPDVCRRCRTFKAKDIPLRVPALRHPVTRSRAR